MSKIATFVTILPRGAGSLLLNWVSGKGAPAGFAAAQGDSQQANGAILSPGAAGAGSNRMWGKSG